MSQQFTNNPKTRAFRISFNWLFFLSFIGVFNDGFGQQIHLLKDINTDRTYHTNYNVSQIVSTGDTIYYVSRTKKKTYDLYVVYGANGGTKKLFSSRESIRGYGLAGLTIFKHKLYFVVTDSLQIQTVWESDGTVANTKPVLDLSPDPGWSFIHIQGTSDDYIVMTAHDPQAGVQLHVSDGTMAGTKVAKTDSNAVSYPNASVFQFQNKMYLNGIFDKSGFNIYAYNKASLIQTPLLRDYFGEISKVMVWGDKFYFFTRSGDNLFYELWESNGAVGEEKKLAAFDVVGVIPQIFGHSDSLLYFAVDTKQNGRDVWVANRDSNGHRLVKDISPGANTDLEIVNYTVLDGSLYFTVKENNQIKLWKSDGTAQGTQSVQFKNGSLANSISFKKPYKLSNLGDSLVLPLQLSKGGNLAAFYNVITDSVSLLSDIGANPNNLVLDGMTSTGQLYFITRDSDSAGANELWLTDGQKDGTVRVAQTVSEINDDASLSDWNGKGRKLFFKNRDQSITEYYTSSGSAETTIKLHDTTNQGEKILIGQTVFFGNEMYCVASVKSTGNELWKFDSISNTLELVRDFNAGGANSNPSYFTKFQGALYFTVLAPSGRHNILNKMDESGQITQVFSLIDKEEFGIITNIENVGEKLFMTISTKSTSEEMWVSDGTAKGTHLTKDICYGCPSIHARPYGWIAGFKDKAYFLANNSINGPELWQSDGTETGTVMVEDFYKNSNDVEMVPIGVTDKYLFYAAAVNDVWKLYVTDGTRDKVREVGSGEINIKSKGVVAGGQAYFIKDGLYGIKELWVTDGDWQPRLIKEFLHNWNGHTESFAVLNDTVYFTASTLENGTEIWKTDGTVEGTVLVQDLFPGTVGSDPRNLKVVGNRLYFSAFHPKYGRELFYIEDTTATPWPLSDHKIDDDALQNKAVLVEVYPNPTSEAVKIHCVSDQVSELNIQVLDIQGKEVFQTTTLDKITMLDLRSYGPGIYFIKVNNTETHKLIKL